MRGVRARRFATIPTHSARPIRNSGREGIVLPPLRADEAYERQALAVAARLWWRIALRATDRTERNQALDRVREIALVALGV
jgi:hypothetical protein